MTCFKWTINGPAIILAASLVGGCATAPAGNNGAEQAAADQKAYEARVANMVKQDPLFALMTAELANQRGDTYSAALAYTEAARQQQDPELAKRAVEISLAEGQLDMALNAAKVWGELVPNDPQVSRSIMLLQLSTNQVEEAMPQLRAYIAELQKAEAANPGLGGAAAEKVALEKLKADIATKDLIAFNPEAACKLKRSEFESGLPNKQPLPEPAVAKKNEPSKGGSSAKKTNPAEAHSHKADEHAESEARDRKSVV